MILAEPLCDTEAQSSFDSPGCPRWRQFKSCPAWSGTEWQQSASVTSEQDGCFNMADNCIEELSGGGTVDDTVID